MHEAKAFPNRKISETFLDFAAPLMQDLPGEAPVREIREVLKVAYTAWNAVIFADVLNNNRYIDWVRRLAANEAGPAMLIEQMIVRKREHFADDARLIGHWTVKRTEDGINLHADARDPHTVPRNPGDRN